MAKKQEKPSDKKKKNKPPRKLSVFQETSLPVNMKYVPGKDVPVKTKCAWTELRLQKLQKQLFKTFKQCGRACETCTVKTDEDTRMCDYIVGEMEKYLIPYGLSIFKRSFKFRATCEEMDRVVTESVNSLLMDVWGKQKKIHSSFGKLLYWKVLYHLDGKLNLFDNDRLQSLDAMIDKFPTNNQDFNAEDVIESLSDTLNNASQHDYIETYRKDTVSTVLGLIDASYDQLSRFIDKKEKTRIFIKCVYGFKRFIDNRTVEHIFHGDGKSKVYYEKMLDTIKEYLKKYSGMSHT